MKNMKNKVTFVECLKATDTLLYWWDGSNIFFRCSCGAKLSYDTPDRNQHFNWYEITETRRRGENWDEFYNRLKNKVSANKPGYRITR